MAPRVKERNKSIKVSAAKKFVVFRYTEMLRSEYNALLVDRGGPVTSWGSDRCRRRSGCNGVANPFFKGFVMHTTL